MALFTVARNLVTDHRRLRANQPVESDAELVTLLVEPDQADDVLLAQTIRRTLARLSREQQAVLNHVYRDDMSYVDAARALGIPLGTAKSRADAALRTLRSAIADFR